MGTLQSRSLTPTGLSMTQSRTESHAPRLSVEAEYRSGLDKHFKQATTTHLALIKSDNCVSHAGLIRPSCQNTEALLKSRLKPPLHEQFRVCALLKNPLGYKANITSSQSFDYITSKPNNWRLNAETRILKNAETSITLTTIESLVLEQLVSSNLRVISKDDLIQRIEKDPQRYSGLEMCLCRLQKKFKNAAKGERLFRSVRNRGYCLAQQIKLS